MSVPSKRHPISPDRAAFRASANPQTASLFLSLLPAEIRQLVYAEVWRASGERQHIFKRRTSILDATPRWGHAPCVTDTSARDFRYHEFRNAPVGSLARATWMSRLQTEWCLHWPCEEANLESKAIGMFAGPSSFLAVLLTCKRMYLDSVISLYENVTFIFTDLIEAGGFLGNYTFSPGIERTIPFRSIELSIRATNLLTELYFPYDLHTNEGPLPIRTGAARLSMEHNPWATVCDLLAQQPDLRDLRIWFDSRDLRPWHRRVSEVRLFAKLFDVKVKSRERFVLELPYLPSESSIRHHLNSGVAHYLRGETLEGAPFTVVRGPRPDNWRVHMANRAMVNPGV